MIWYKDEAEVDAMIEKMKNRTKGKHITQGVSFNKECPRQMELLKMALMGSVSFSGLVKELLALKYTTGVPTTDIGISFSDDKVDTQPKKEVAKEEIVTKQPSEAQSKVVEQKIDNKEQATRDSSFDNIPKSNLQDFMS